VRSRAPPTKTSSTKEPPSAAFFLVEGQTDNRKPHRRRDRNIFEKNNGILAAPAWPHGPSIGRASYARHRCRHRRPAHGSRRRAGGRGLHQRRRGLDRHHAPDGMQARPRCAREGDARGEGLASSRSSRRTKNRRRARRRALHPISPRRSTTTTTWRTSTRLRPLRRKRSPGSRDDRSRPRSRHASLRLGRRQKNGSRLAHLGHGVVDVEKKGNLGARLVAIEEALIRVVEESAQKRPASSRSSSRKDAQAAAKLGGPLAASPCSYVAARGCPRSSTPRHA